MLCSLSKKLFFFCMLFTSLFPTPASANGGGEPAWSKSTSSTNSDKKLGYAFLVPSTSSTWKFENSNGTTRYETTTYSIARYRKDSANAGVRITEESPDGPIPTRDYYDLYSLPQSLRLNVFMELLKHENGCASCTFSLDTRKHLVKVSRPATPTSTGSYFHFVDYWYLTDPSPFKTQRPAYVNITYAMFSTTGSSTAINQFTAADFSNYNGVLNNYLRNYPNRL